MKRVVIGVDKKGKPYVVSIQGKVEVIIKNPDRMSFKKRVRTTWYHVKTWFQ